MSSVSENGILDKAEFEAYKQRTVRSRFMHQILLGAGGATVFGVVGGLTKALIDGAVGAVATTSAAAAGAAATTTAVGGAFALGTLGSVLGLAALGVAGLVCLYMGAKYMSQTILLDQDFQAKKIGLAARGVEPTMAAQPEVTKPVAVPGLGATNHAKINQASLVATPLQPASKVSVPAQHIGRALNMTEAELDAVADMGRA